MDRFLVYNIPWIMNGIAALPSLIHNSSDNIDGSLIYNVPLNYGYFLSNP